MSLNYRNLDKLKTYKKLSRTGKPFNLEQLDAARVKGWQMPAGGGLTFNYAARPVFEKQLALLQELADEAELIGKYRAILSGEVMNTGEKRMVLHQLTRGQQLGPVMEEGRDKRAFYSGQQERIYQFADKVHKGEIKGSTGKKFDTVVQIGIGGSDLGPRAMYLALENLADPLLRGRFISNVDPDDPNAVLKKLDFETTLFVLVSKSGTTQETLANRFFILENLRKKGIPGLDPSKHMVAVTSETSPLAGSSDVLDSFYIDDYIGGRYSSTSAVGGVVLTLAFGRKMMEGFLNGAAEADKLALGSDIRNNPAMMDALLGLFERNILGYPSTAVLPYSQALSRFPAHLQQLDMESNGKSVNRFGESVGYVTGPVIFGEPGTNGQHSFYQLLHQGTDIIPLQFIGFRNPQINSDLEYEGSTGQQKLKANLAAQIIAFAKGKKSEDRNKYFAGQRPSSLIHADSLTPEALGALLAHYENKVMFQGFLWNVNSFDQEGVQLGKVLTGQVLKGKDLDGALSAYAEILKI
jgi:glucose-6-phosphate isomerase